MDKRILGDGLILTGTAFRSRFSRFNKPRPENAERFVETSREQGLTRHAALVATFTALGVSMAPFTWFFFLGTKAFPGQHFINALAGVILGPYWASLAALMVGAMRNILGIGTIFAFPGGIPGALIVGLAYELTKRFRNRLLRYSAALLEPVGTVVIGASASLLILAPLVGWKPLLVSVERYGVLLALWTLWGGWAISSVSGSVLGYVVLLGLDRAGVLVRMGRH